MVFIRSVSLLFKCTHQSDHGTRNLLFGVTLDLFLSYIPINDTYFELLFSGHLIQKD